MDRVGVESNDLLNEDNFNSELMNSSGNKQMVSSAIQKINYDNKRNMIRSAHPKQHNIYQ